VEAVSRRVLITDAETRAAVATARGLHDAGFEVAAVASSGACPAPAHWSRAVKTRLVAPDPLSCPDAFLEAIERAAAHGRYALLIPVSDAALLAVSRNRDRLEPHVQIGLPPRDVVERCLDKLALTESAARHEMRPLATIACDGSIAAAAAATRLGFPLFAKAASSIVEVGGVRRRVGSRPIRNQRELQSVVAELGDRLLLQQIERGRVVSFAGVLVDRVLLAEAVSRYHRTWHPQAGSAAFSETIDAPPVLRHNVVALLIELGW
jgi:predicted ATP-grasp superfamily ATP-dependent carboligase